MDDIFLNMMVGQQSRGMEDAIQSVKNGFKRQRDIRDKQESKTKELNDEYSKQVAIAKKRLLNV